MHMKARKQGVCLQYRCMSIVCILLSSYLPCLHMDYNSGLLLLFFFLNKLHVDMQMHIIVIAVQLKTPPVPSGNGWKPVLVHWHVGAVSGGWGCLSVMYGVSHGQVGRGDL